MGFSADEVSEIKKNKIKNRKIIALCFFIVPIWYVTFSNIIVSFWFSASRGWPPGEHLFFNFQI